MKSEQLCKEAKTKMKLPILALLVTCCVMLCSCGCPPGQHWIQTGETEQTVWHAGRAPKTYGQYDPGERSYYETIKKPQGQCVPDK